MHEKNENLFIHRKIDVVHSAYILHALYQQQQLEKYCDLKILVGYKQYFVHRCVLAAASPKLDSQINGLDTIHLVGVTNYGFECLLEILYLGKLHNISSLSSSRFQQIISAADALNSEPIMEYCVREREDLVNRLFRQNNVCTPKEVNDEDVQSSLEVTETIVHKPAGIRTPNKIDTRSHNDDSELVCSIAAEVVVESVQKDKKLQDNEVIADDVSSNGCLVSTSGPPPMEVEPGQNHILKDDREEETRMSCEICPAVFLNAAELNLHMYSHKKEKLLRCEECLLQFKNETALLTHSKHHCRCQMCGLKLNTAAELRDHLKTHLGFSVSSTNNPVNCKSEVPKTNAPFKRKSKMLFSAPRDDTPDKSPLEKEDMDTDPASVNEIVRDDNGKYQCPFCDRGFDRRWNLKCHVLIHTNGVKSKKSALEARYVEAVFTCPECGRLFNNLHNLRRHASAVHRMTASDLDEASDSPSLEVSLTPKKIKITKKESQEDGVDVFKFCCTICSRGFKRKRNLLGHMETHQSQKYECPVCQRCFPQKESLNGHLWVHKNKPETKRGFQ